jgi:5-methylcytosine-specific restriction endonuclease McrA
MSIDYSQCAIPKGSPRIVDKVRKQKIDQQSERICRSVVRARDKGRCRIPNCNERDVEMHHIVPRSRSSKLKWHPGNNCLLCRNHHGLRHAGKIQIAGDADGELIITGDIDCLKFRI